VGLVGAVEEYVRRFAEASKIAAVVETSPEARLARLAPEAEAQAFRIVQESLTNVRKHAGARRAALEIEVEGGSLLIRVSDDGRGLAAADGGTPDWPRYGLQAMRERAAAIGGSIDWTSHPGSGVTVRIAVPLAGGGEPHADRPRRRPHALSRRCRLAARGWGHEIVGLAADGAEAVALAERLRPDLVLMDVSMPGLGGLEATRRLAARQPQIPIVILTVSEDEDDLFRAIQYGLVATSSRTSRRRPCGR